MKYLFLTVLVLASAGAHAEESYAPNVSTKPIAAQPTVAMNADSGTAVHAGEILSVGKKAMLLVDKKNGKVELAPQSVAEFNESGDLKLLRGSALLETHNERVVRTSSAEVDYTGRVLVSYDFKELSTSAFVLEGEARMVNPSMEEHSLRLERFRGATLEVGGVLPQLIRELNFASVSSWLKGYAWPEERSQAILKELPQSMTAEVAKQPEYLEQAKIEDYFSAIESGDEDDQPNYYNKKFADPDTTVAEANAKKTTVTRGQRPEEAALISLPSTKIDLGFEVVGLEQKEEEVRHLGKKKPAARSLASIPAKKPKATTVKAEKPSEGGDPEVNEVLERLRGLTPKSALVSQVPEQSARGGSSRGPASVGPSLIPDPVYDYSENF